MVDVSQYAEAVNGALAEGSPCSVVTVDEQGRPNIGLKGSVMVFDAQHLAYWERSHARTEANLRARPHVAVQYANLSKRQYVRFFGQAEVHESGPVREQIMARVIAPELNRDPERRGFGILIRVESVVDPFRPAPTQGA